MPRVISASVAMRTGSSEWNVAQSRTVIPPGAWPVARARKSLQVVARSEVEPTAGVIGVVELVIADPHLNVGLAEAIVAATDEAPEAGGHAEVLGLIDQVLDEVRSFETVEGDLARALEL